MSRYGYDSDFESDSQDGDDDDAHDENLHPTKYERQVVLQVQRDQTLARMASLLNSKHPTKSAQFNWYDYSELECVMGDPIPLPQNARIYLVGHGDGSGLHLGRKTGQFVASQLARYMNPKTPVARISVVGCYTTATSAIREPEGFCQRAGLNFAQQLHQYLATAHHIFTSVSGRGVCVWVDEDEENGNIQKTTATAELNSALNIYEANEPRQHQRHGDKIVYYWVQNGNRFNQHWRHAY